MCGPPKFVDDIVSPFELGNDICKLVGSSLTTTRDFSLSFYISPRAAFKIVNVSLFVKIMNM